MITIHEVKGYHIRVDGRDCFLPTIRVNRSRKLAADFARRLMAATFTPGHPTADQVEYVNKHMLPVVMKVRRTDENLLRIDFIRDNRMWGTEISSNPFRECVVL